MKNFKTLEEAQAAFDKLATDHEALSKDNKALTAASNEKDALIKKIRAKKTEAGAGKPSFTFDKKVYEVNAASFSYKGEKYTAKDLCSDESLQKALIEEKVGFISLAASEE